MLTFEELYRRIVLSSQSKEVDEELTRLNYDPYHLECILTPSKTNDEWITPLSACHVEGKSFVKCLFDHLDQEGNIRLDQEEKCTGCFDYDMVKVMLTSKDNVSVLEALHARNRPVFALIAPAFLSQFEIVNDGQLRSAFKQIGFAGMVEVSLFADILTLKEALEFDKEISNEADFQLTSCCCPIWINMIRKVYPELLSHVPKAVSPMIATGRVIKKMIPEAITVFIGPCLAKKAEAKEEDIQDAIDIVLTFQEINQIFKAAKVDASKLSSDLREHSSTAGRIYAITGGVSEAVALSVKRLKPERPIQVRPIQGNGILECKSLLKKIQEGAIEANFIEGMGCVGGCVGGPRAIIQKEVATHHVKDYAYDSLYATPIDNPYVIELLHRLNMHTIDDLLSDHEIFTRHF